MSEIVGAALLVIGWGVFMRWLLSPNERKSIYGVYSQPGKYYYVKFIFFYLLVNFRQWRSKQARNGSKETEAVGYGAKSKYDISAMEGVQQLSSHPKAIDAVYFQGGNRDGLYFVAATARRPHRVVNGFVFLRIPQEGLLLSPKLPDSLMFGTADEFGAEGLKFTLIEPMRKWRIQYQGQLRRDKSKELVDVEIDAIWSTQLEQFDFDTDMSTTTLSRAIAREPWSREYFQTLKDAHQTHYEQMGDADGTVTVAGKQYPFHINSMRDHSYGHKREWKLLHRYGFHTMTLENGMRINVGIVSQPCTSSELELGYVYSPDGQLFPVEKVDLNLWNIGEKGTPPTDYYFTFEAANETWAVQVNVIESPVFHIGWEWEARIVERMCTFEVNGVPGWGVSEFMYNHKNGRPTEFSRNDPEWTRDINKG